MRIRNPRTFVLWAMFNVASHYGRGGSNFTFLFGIYVSQNDLLCNIDDVKKYDSFTMKSINSMQYMELVIGTVDSSYIIKDLKFQAGGHFILVTLVTSRMFIKPMIPHVLTIFKFPIACP